jgi:hypothetical protein
MALKGNFIPPANFFRIQMINHGEGVQLVETWSYVAILDIRQTAKMNDEVGTTTLTCQFVTCPFDISVGQTEALPRPAQPRARLHVRSGKFSWVAQTPYGHGTSYLSVTFPEQRFRPQRAKLLPKKRIAQLSLAAWNNRKETAGRLFHKKLGPSKQGMKL